MTQLWLAGAENPSHHHLFSDCGITRVALNVSSMVRNYSSGWTLGFEEEEWIAWADTVSTPEDLVTAIDAMQSLPTYAVAPKGSGWERHEQYADVWDGNGDFPQTYIDQILFVTDKVYADAHLSRRLLSSKKRGMQFGVITGKKDNLERFDHVISTAWWNVNKNGETQIWDGHKLHRLNSSDKFKKRAEFEDHIIALGVNFNDVMNDDPEAVAELAIRSWKAYEDARLDIYKPSTALAHREGDELSDLAISGSGSRIQPVIQRRERQMLPVMDGFIEQEEEEDGTLTDKWRLKSTADSIRQCNNCFLSGACPAYQPDHSCAYSMPVEITTKDDLGKVLGVMIEVQTQRVFQARHAEEVMGQELSPETGREMDRLFKLADQKEKIMEEGVDKLRLEIQAKAGGGGILSKMFGSNVGQNAQALPPMDSNAVIDVLAEG